MRTIANMVDQLSDDFEFKIITSDRDAFDTESYADIQVNAWNSVGKAEVYYVASEKRTFNHFKHILTNTKYDVLYLNSLFAYQFTIKPLILRRLGLILCKPVVIAPRGEFSEGALVLKSSKKKLYLALAKTFGLYRNLIWQASSECEKGDIRRVMGSQAQEVMVASDLPSALPLLPEIKKSRVVIPDNSLKIIFLSRITPMKNLDFALHVLAQLKCPVIFDLFGIVDDETYWSKCKELVKQLPEHIMVNYKGSIPHQKVLSTFSQYDLFFLPTRGENYGHVIFESLAAGTPALISDQTPWHDLEEHGIGWALPLSDMQAFITCINNLSQTAPEERHLMSLNSQKYAIGVNNNADVIAANKDLFLRACGLPDEIEQCIQNKAAQ